MVDDENGDEATPWATREHSECATVSARAGPTARDAVLVPSSHRARLPVEAANDERVRS